MVKQSDIAKAAGFSLSVVSRALSHTKGKNDTLSDDTRRQVREIARKMGYTPNYHASCLRKGRVPIIGVFLPTWTGYLLCELLMGMSKAANECGFPLDIYFDMSIEAYSRFIDSMNEQGNSGIISYVPKFNDDKIDPKIFTKMASYRKNGGKIVFLNAMNVDLGDIPTVSVDEEHGGMLAGEHLCSKKCGDYYGLHSSGGLYLWRIKGFVDSIKRRDARADVHAVAMPNCGIGDEYDFLRNPDGEIWGRAEERPIGIFCTADIITRHVIHYAQRNGFVPGKDFHVVSYDRDAMGREPLEYPRIIQPFFDIGHQGVLTLLNMIKGGNEASKILKPVLQAT